MDERLPVVVGVDGSAGSDAAVQWAVAEGLARRTSLRIVHAYEWTHTPVPLYRSVPDADLQMPRHVAEQLVQNMIARAALLGSTNVGGAAIDGDAAGVLMGEARYGCELLGSRRLGALGSAVHGSVSAAVAARATCPVVVVRGPAGRPDERAAVVVGSHGHRALTGSLLGSTAQGVLHHATCPVAVVPTHNLR